MTAIVLLCADAPALAAQESGSTTVAGSRLSWRVSDAAPQRHLAVLAPSFARWTTRGFETPVEFRIATNYAAFIDQWELSLYRSGDLARRRPLARFRGGTANLAEPLLWDGRSDDGIDLRPGETVHAILAIRDAAGNIDEAAPQAILVGRYLMPSERKARTKEERRRADGFAGGAKPTQLEIPLTGPAVAINLPGDDASDWLLSGLPMRADDRTLRLEQIMPPGRYQLLVEKMQQAARRKRAIPVGTATLDVPGDESLLARVKGTGVLARRDTVAPIDPPDMHFDDGVVSGADALGATLIGNENLPRAKLAMATIDPEGDVVLLRNLRKHRFLYIPVSPETALWAGRAAARSIPDDGHTRRNVVVAFPAKAFPALTLPETDILSGSVRVSVIAEGLTAAALVPGLHYLTEFSEGRILMTLPGQRLIAEAAKDHASYGREPELIVRYEIPAIAGSATATRSYRFGDSGESTARSNAELAGFETRSAGLDRAAPPGWFERAFSWLLGGA